jgi:hypothetical protein
MKNTRARLAAAATVLGLGALGGVAMETNHGLPAASQPIASTATAGQGPIVTSASGAAAPASQPVALPSATTTRPPIVTGASGSGAGRPGLVEVDD